MKKKFISVFALTALGLLTLAACGGTSSSSQGSSVSSSSTPSSSQSTNSSKPSVSSQESSTVSSNSSTPSTPSSTTVVVSNPTLNLPSENEYTVKAGEDFTLPTVTAEDYDGSNLTEYIEVEDVFENGAIKDGVFNAKTCGDHILSYYVEADDGRYAEGEITIHVTPSHEENFETEGFTDVSAISTYGTFKENFEKGRRSPLAAVTDANNATELTATDEAIAGNSMFIDADKTAGSALNAVFFDAFNDYFPKGKATTYTVSFDYKILENSNFALKDFYFGLSWDNFDGLNNAFVKSTDEVGKTYTYTCSFPAAVIPTTEKAYFRFFKLGASQDNKAKIVVDNFVISSSECAETTKVVPTAEQLLADGGFTWDWKENGSAATNGETIIIDNLENEAAKTAMQASDKFSENALRLINADTHLFEGLNKNNLLSDKKIIIDLYYYAVNDNGFHLLMLNDTGNSDTLTITNEKEGDINHVRFESNIKPSWQALNIYGQENPNFEIYLGKLTVQLVDADVVPDDQTPNGHKVGDEWTISSRQWGNENKGAIKTEAFDGDAEVIENELMGDAPTKFTFNGKDCTMEWFQAGGKIEENQKYEITTTYYVKSFTEGAKLEFNIDNQVFMEIGNDGYLDPGFHQETISWQATRTVDFFSFYISGAMDVEGVIYVASVNIKLVEIVK